MGIWSVLAAQSRTCLVVFFTNMEEGRHEASAFGRRPWRSECIERRDFQCRSFLLAEMASCAGCAVAHMRLAVFRVDEIPRFDSMIDSTLSVFEASTD